MGFWDEVTKLGEGLTPWNDEALGYSLRGGWDEFTGEAGKKRAEEAAGLITETGRLRREAQEEGALKQAERLQPFVGIGSGALSAIQSGDYGPVSKRFKFELERGREEIAAKRTAAGALRSSGTLARNRRLTGRLATKEYERKRRRQEELLGLGALAVGQGGFLDTGDVATSLL